MKQTLNLRQQLSINLRYCYSSRREPHKLCRRSAIRPPLVWTSVPYRRQQSLSRCITCQDDCLQKLHAVLPQASRQKSLDSQKKFTRYEKIPRFKVFASKFAVLPEMMYLFTSLPKNLYIICKFVKMDHVEAWKISC